MVELFNLVKDNKYIHIVNSYLSKTQSIMLNRMIEYMRNEEGLFNIQINKFETTIDDENVKWVRMFDIEIYTTQEAIDKFPPVYQDLLDNYNIKNISIDSKRRSKFIDVESNTNISLFDLD